MALLTLKEEKLPITLKPGDGAWSGEAMALCPQCKALQTIWLSDGILMPTRKFIQEGSRIYHDCSSGLPCHLFHSW